WNADCGIKSKKALIQNPRSKIKNVPIAALTAYAMRGDREKTLEAGCSGHIEKPIDPATFADEVKKFMEVRVL
ncbi:MAG: hypothetical protein KAV87_02505, partial [Desulfobacteraceae bacterium]|nr:hypothetical protein [Desulfobacteraceae bacterium]